MDSQIPAWMKSRETGLDPINGLGSKVVKAVSMMVLVAAFLAAVAFSVYAAAERAAWFHIAVIATGAVLLTIMLVYCIQGNLWTASALFISAGAANYALYQHAKSVTENISGLIALVFGILYTGLCALLLLSRSDVKLTRPAKVILMMSVLALCVTGPLMYVSGLTEGTVGSVTGYLLVLSIPMIPLTLATFVMVSSRHRSEVTLPSDNWI